MKIIIITLIFFTLIRAETYPIVYSKFATPLFKAENIFSKYIELSDIKEQHEIYRLEVEQLIAAGFLLDKKLQKNKKDLHLYLKSIRELEKKHNYLLVTLSKHLLDAIKKNDYDSFLKLANIPLKSFYKSSSFKQKVLTYYKINNKINKITILENMINDEKIKYVSSLNQKVINNNLNLQNTNTKNKLDNIYWTSSINSNNNATEHNGYIYGGKKSAIHASSKVLDLGITLGGVCSDQDGNIYWANTIENIIYKSDSNGENIRKIITSAVHPRNMIIDTKKEHIYWSDWSKENDGTSGKISYADLDGRNQRTIIKHRLKSAGSLDIDYTNSKLYITDPSSNGIYTSGLEGIGLKLIAYSPNSTGIVVDGKNNRVIWSDTSTDKIYSTDLDGKNKKTIIIFNDAFANPNHVKIDYERQRLVYTINVEHQGVIESSDMNGNDRRIEFSAEQLYNVGGIFIR